MTGGRIKVAAAGVLAAWAGVSLLMNYWQVMVPGAQDLPLQDDQPVPVVLFRLGVSMLIVGMALTGGAWLAAPRVSSDLPVKAIGSRRSDIWLVIAMVVIFDLAAVATVALAASSHLRYKPLLPAGVLTFVGAPFAIRQMGLSRRESRGARRYKAR